ncbi:type I DNA topoisomerase [Oceanidesulfovibrio marinus]|uniref:DNA topoisomerase 1 n=1 Tax=Oceanidesulfovibrio marinus TaxID=370038 RepID=A0A6P1ZJI3_9BACT|nr:type I DNA topoisomerase [Oceanidesulfovibrio marinus]TVM35753.1 type I DNA topoisomerase [Oceanidesulfovibrio marinus]
MGKNLIIVESPAKVRTIKKFLGSDYEVEASVGHVRDLPPNKLGVDEEHDFTPEYQIIQGKQNVVSKLKKAAARSERVYLAPDPDREGEAIAWHVAELIKGTNQNIERIQFNEITPRAVREALEHPRTLDGHLYESQQARRILDRLVGYKLSPLLWKKVKRGISAGRVQSVALKIVVEREKERRAFVPEEYWLFKAKLALESQKADEAAAFEAELSKVKGKKPKIGSADEAEALEKDSKANPFSVADVQEKERSRTPPPPFITSTLQQHANQRLGYSAKKTMSTAQRLYEGVDLGDRGVMALITYMRTDSVRIAKDAQDAAREFILDSFGKEYYPPKARHFKTKSGAQDAHEAIRPVDVAITPDSVKADLPRDQLALYRVIWERFVASQMAAAKFWDTTVTVANGDLEWRAKGERLLFPGFLAVTKAGASKSQDLPKLEAKDILALLNMNKEQKFTQPPPRYTEASLVRELEEKGIGRPSTYAAIISTLLDRDYARLEDKHFAPTDLGGIVSDLLDQHFQELMDVAFTANMEASLDKVAEGGANWVELLKTFTGGFYDTLAEAAENMASVKQGLPTDIVCEECGKPMVIKFGKAGQFLACTGYPECRNTKNFYRDENGTIQVAPEDLEKPQKVGECPKCGSDLVIKKARTGSRFIACTGYPKCDYAQPFSTGVACPKEGCPGELVEKSSRRGKVFYACNQYPKCDYAVWDWPVPEPCPQCGSKILVRKTTKARGEHLACPDKKCRYTRELEEESETV